MNRRKVTRRKTAGSAGTANRAGLAAAPSAYRWVVLGVYMLVTLAVEVQWVALAPVSRAAERFYAGQVAAGSFFGVDFLAMLYLVLYLVVALPASYVIDTYGLRIGLGAGALLAGVAGLAKGIFAASFTAVLVSQIALAIAQPFILNAATALGARWFPLRERGLAVGLASLAQYLGIVLAMVVGPILVNGNPASPAYGQGVGSLLLAYGAGTAGVAAVSLFLVRERPRGAAAAGEERLAVFSGMKSLVANRDFRILFVLFLVGLGMFNAISSMVDAIAAHIGVVDSDGLIGTFMIVGGIIGALALPLLSDKVGKRKPFLVACLAGMVPGVAGLAFAGALTRDAASAYTVAKVSAGILGFFVMSAGPIGFQYAAEIGRPAPESTSQGLLLLVGQASGILFMALMGVRSLIGPLFVVFVILAAYCAVQSVALRESLAGPGKPAHGRGESV
jgi:MFS family permease